METKRKSRKYTNDDFTKFTLFQSQHRTLYCAWGGNGASYLRAIKLDTPYRKSMVGIGNTLEKGLWWKGEETGNVPKFFWVYRKGWIVNIFVGRFAILLQTKKNETLPFLEIR